MKVGVNGFIAARSTAGVARHCQGLLQAMAALNSELEVHTFSDRPLDTNVPGCSTLRQHVFRAPVYTLWEQIGLPLLLARSGLALFHSPAFVLPLLGPLPGVVTIHDLTHVLFPSYHPIRRRRYLRWLMPSSLRRARRIITVSYHTKKDLCRLFGVPEDKVRVVYNGVGSEFRVVDQPERLEDFRSRYGLPVKFVLYVGTIEPRKNLDRLIHAFDLLRQQGVEHQLVLAGARGWGCEGLRQLPTELGLEGEVCFLDFVPEADLPLLYNAADVLVYPSLYEGFGLPALEAMACGTPVVASNTSSLPEVVGSGGLLVDPYDAESLADAILQSLRSPSLREELRESGLKQAAQFTWSRAAKQTLAVFKEALASADDAIGVPDTPMPRRAS